MTGTERERDIDMQRETHRGVSKSWTDTVTEKETEMAESWRDTVTEREIYKCRERVRVGQIQ